MHLGGCGRLRVDEFLRECFRLLLILLFRRNMAEHIDAYERHKAAVLSGVDGSLAGKAEPVDKRMKYRRLNVRNIQLKIRIYFIY